MTLESILSTDLHEFIINLCHPVNYDFLIFFFSLDYTLSPARRNVEVEQSKIKLLLIPSVRGWETK